MTRINSWLSQPQPSTVTQHRSVVGRRDDHDLPFQRARTSNLHRHKWGLEATAATVQEQLTIWCDMRHDSICFHLSICGYCFIAFHEQLCQSCWNLRSGDFIVQKSEHLQTWQQHWHWEQNNRKWVTHWQWHGPASFIPFSSTISSNLFVHWLWRLLRICLQLAVCNDNFNSFT